MSIAVISSPYTMRGELYRSWQSRFGKSDEHVLVVLARLVGDGNDCARLLDGRPLVVVLHAGPYARGWVCSYSRSSRSLLT